MNQRDALRQIKQSIAAHHRFRGRCYVCGCKKSKSGMTFHHLYYTNTERTYSDFKNPLEYYTYLKPIILAEPYRFLYLCSDHHQALERLCRWGDRNLSRLLRARRLTKK